MLSRRTLIVSLAALAVAGVAGCARSTTLKSDATLMELSADAPSVPAIGDAIRALGWDVLQQQEGDGNQLISPSSLALALGMLGEGATGESAKAIDEIFGVSGDERSEALGGWKQSLASFETDPKELDMENPPETPLVHLAAQVALVQDNEVEQSFLDRLATYYGAEVVAVDGWQDLKPVLDAFAKEETAGLIEQSAITPDEMTRLVLQDALLFAAAWSAKFNHEGTLDFHTPKEVKSVESFSGERTITALEEADVTAVRLPCTERFAVDVILPSDPASISTERLQSITEVLADAEGKPRKVYLRMPKSSQTGKLDLLEQFQALGLMPGTYDGIFDNAVLQAVDQQVKLIVGARGVVGAALTEAAVGATAVEEEEPPLEFTVDRPYVLQVIDVEHGWPLFLSVIEDPTQE